MSDHYFALIDLNATADDASDRAEILRRQFLQERIIERVIEPSSNSREQFEYHAAPHLRDVYHYRPATEESPPEFPWFESLSMPPVEFIADRWINSFGFLDVESVACPSCRSVIPFEQIRDAFGDAAGSFLDGGSMLVRCPKCEKDINAKEWSMTPHLGFCHLAIVFWFWPSLTSSGWQISIPAIASNALNTEWTITYGRI